VDGETIVWAWARLALAAVCVAVLVAARWHHERQVALLGSRAGRRLRDVPEAWLEHSPAAARAGSGGVTVFGRRVPALSYPLYWLGLTTSAALAAQAISVLALAAMQ
jgi:hypothetical protein